jgi:hypothetical protein
MRQNEIRNGRKLRRRRRAATLIAMLAVLGALAAPAAASADCSPSASWCCRAPIPDAGLSFQASWY